MSGYVFENMEIASYTVLIEAAKVAQDTETHRVCEAILQQEIAMSDWLRQHLPELTQAFLRRSAAPETEPSARPEDIAVSDDDRNRHCLFTAACLYWRRTDKEKRHVSR